MRTTITTIAAVCVIALATTALAQDSPEMRQQAAERYIKSPGQQNMLDQMLSPEVAAAQMAAQFPQLPADKRAELAAISAEELAKVRPDMEAAMISAAVDTFTAEEITALDEFYRTPVGSSVLLKMQPFMQSSFAAMGPAMRRAQAAIAARAAGVMKP